MTTEDFTRPEESLSVAARHMVGLETWEPQLGHGSLLLIDIGPPRTNSIGNRVGAYTLWVFGSYWEIRRDESTLATAEESREAMAEAAASLSGRRVLSLIADAQTLSLRLLLSDGFELVTTPARDPELEEWLLYLDDGNVLTAGPGMTLSLEDASAVPPGDP